MSNTSPDSDVLLWEALPDLTLNIAQTASLCGISVRQLGYWTRQGYVAAQGRGARRTYGLEAIRHVLAIRKTMDGGASLRQALRLIGGLPPTPLVRPARILPASVVPASALGLEEMERLAFSLQMLFETNWQTRDCAAGLSVKLGRAEEDVLLAAERLCLSGILAKSVRQGMVIFQQVGREAASA